MKKYKKGMVLGKFYPPHNGHMFLIDTALEQCESVDVFVCSLPTETIPGMLRTFWIWKHYRDSGTKNINVIPISDELPQTPEEHGDKDDFYKLWCNVVNSNSVNLDAIFTSESYGEEFAEYLGLKHVLVDIERVTHSVSGTSIRNNPVENWEHIPAVVRTHFKRVVAILGPESTGKSTLTKQLAEHFDGDMVEEYGRDYTDETPAKELKYGDYLVIAYTHDTNIMDKLHDGTKSHLFIDTDGITTKLFAEMYLGDELENDEIDSVINQQVDQFDLVLVCDIDVPWVDDGTRDFSKIEDRKRHLDKILNELTKRKIPYKIVSGNYAERLEVAKQYICELNVK